MLTSATGFQGTTTAATDGTQSFATGNSLVFTVAGGGAASVAAPTTITLNATTLAGLTSDVSKVSADTVVTAINNQLANATVPTGVTASKTTDGRIVFTSTDTGAAAKATVNVTSGNRDIGFGTTAGAQTATGSDAANGAVAASVAGIAVAGLATGGTGPDFSGAADASFTIKLGDGPAKKIDLTGAADATLALATDAKATDIATAINKQLTADTGFSGKVTAVGDDTTGKVTFTTKATGSDQKITVDASASGADTDIGFGIAGATTKPVVGSGTGSAGGVNATRTSLAKQFNTLLDQITQQAKDSSYNGINLLYRSGSDAKENSLKVTFNETGSSSLNIEGAKLDSEGLGLNTVTGGFQSDAEINDALKAITLATSQLRAQSSTFGSNLSVVQNRQDFAKNLINILDTGSANL
ncbi:hypothetical protein ASF39_19810, partial [Methylobacterium sp. Leaf108]